MPDSAVTDRAVQNGNWSDPNTWLNHQVPASGANVWIMPEGTDGASVAAGLASLAEPVLARGWHLSSRLHILIWSDRRGV